jgi:metallo-beta-lactamase family protein
MSLDVNFVAHHKEFPRKVKGRFSAPIYSVFIVHGEQDASEALRVRIERELGWPSVVPRQNQEFRL